MTCERERSQTPQLRSEAPRGLRCVVGSPLHESDLLGLVDSENSGRQQQITSHRLSDNCDQSGNVRSAQEDPQASGWDAERRVWRNDSKVARHGKLQPGTQRRAINRSNHRSRIGDDRVKQPFERRSERIAPAMIQAPDIGGPPTQIGSSAERALAGSSNDDSSQPRARLQMS